MRKDYHFPLFGGTYYIISPSSPECIIGTAVQKNDNNKKTGSTFVRILSLAVKSYSKHYICKLMS